MAKITWSPDLDTCWIECVEIGHGHLLYICWSRHSVTPCGMVWSIAFRADSGKQNFLVLGSYVPPFARRKGIRTLINQKILEHVAVILSPNATREGKAFMKAAGYTTDGPTGMYLLAKASRLRHKR